MNRAVTFWLIVLTASCSKPAAEPAPGAAAGTPAVRPSSAAGDVRVKVAQPSGTVVVVLEGSSTSTLPSQAEKPIMDQVSQTFGPEFMFVRTGEPVEFRNSDDTLHNVHVTHEETHEPQFNVAIPTGAAFAYTFKRDGFYRVGCDIHPAMSAVIFAAPTPYAGLADSDGSIEFTDVAPGVYQLFAYSGGTRRQMDVEVKRGRNTVTLE